MRSSELMFLVLVAVSLLVLCRAVCEPFFSFSLLSSAAVLRGLDYRLLLFLLLMFSLLLLVLRGRSGVVCWVCRLLLTI